MASMRDRGRRASSIWRDDELCALAVLRARGPCRHAGVGRRSGSGRVRKPCATPSRSRRPTAAGRAPVAVPAPSTPGDVHDTEIHLIAHHAASRKRPATPSAEVEPFVSSSCRTTPEIAMRRAAEAAWAGRVGLRRYGGTDGDRGRYRRDPAGERRHVHDARSQVEQTRRRPSRQSLPTPRDVSRLTWHRVWGVAAATRDGVHAGEAVRAADGGIVGRPGGRPRPISTAPTGGCSSRPSPTSPASATRGRGRRVAQSDVSPARRTAWWIFDRFRQALLRAGVPRACVRSSHRPRRLMGVNDRALATTQATTCCVSRAIARCCARRPARATSRAWLGGDEFLVVASHDLGLAARWRASRRPAAARAASAAVRRGPTASTSRRSPAVALDVAQPRAPTSRSHRHAAASARQRSSRTDGDDDVEGQQAPTSRGASAQWAAAANQA